VSTLYLLARGFASAQNSALNKNCLARGFASAQNSALNKNCDFPAVQLQTPS